MIIDQDLRTHYSFNHSFARHMPIWKAVSGSFTFTQMVKKSTKMLELTVNCNLMHGYRCLYLLIIFLLNYPGNINAQEPDHYFIPDTIFIGNQEKPDEIETTWLSGYISDGSTGDVLIGANIMIRELNTGAVSDEKGFFRLPVNPGIYHMIFSSMGFQEIERIMVIYSSGSVDIELFEKTMMIQQVEIKAEASNGDFSGPQMSSVKITMEKINSLPAFLGEVDIVKSIVLLPGISSTGDAVASIHVRGGSADQNLFLLDEVPLFNLTHMFGFFSAVNPEIVSDVTVFKGGIPSKYGGRLSSVIDIQLKDKVVNKTNFSASTGLISARLNMNIPMIREKSCIVAGGRISYLDWILRKIEHSEINRSGASFYDVNLKYIHEFNGKNKLNFSGYQSYDNFRFGNESSQAYLSRYITGRYNRIINERSSFRILMFRSEFNSSLAEFTDTAKASVFHTGIINTGITGSYSLYTGSIHHIDAGTDLNFYRFHPGTRAPYFAGSYIKEDKLADEQSVELAAYFSHRIDLFYWLNLTYGLRYSYFSLLGPGDVIVYAANVPRTEESIIDSLHFKTRESIKDYHGPEPRFAVKFNIDNDHFIKLSYNRMRQCIHLYSNTTTVTPADIWKPSNTVIRPQVSDQVAAGFYKYWRDLRMESSFEIYYKKINNIMDVRGGGEVLMNDLLETDLLAGWGRAYGAEFFIRKNTGRLTGWINYTYSHTERKIEDHIQQASINGGQFYPADYDTPHDLNVTLNYELITGFTATVSYVFSSGRPVTYPVGYYSYNNIPVIQYSDKNSYRLNDYRRLDLGFNIDFKHGKTNRWASRLSFSVYNLFGRDNPYSVFFRNEQNLLLKGYQVFIINRAVPSVSFSLFFN